MSSDQPMVVEVDGRPALVVGGVVQSVLIEGLPPEGSYWHAMLPDRRPSRVLLLGLGGGTLAHLLTRRFGPVPLVGVEASGEVVALARRHFGLDDLPHLRVVVADAFAYVARSVPDDASHHPAERFDQIYIDLFVGNELAPRVLARPFLRQLTRLLLPAGTVTFNLFRDRRSDERLHRLRKVYSVVRAIPVGKNLVVWCRP